MRPEASVEGRLAEIGPRLAVPPVDVASAVAARVVEERPRRTVVPLPRSRSVRRAVAVAVAAVLLLGAAAVAGRLGVPGLRVLFEPGPGPTQVPLGHHLLLGERTTLRAARDAVAFPVATPHDAGLGPATVYVGRRPAGGRVTLVYPAGPGLPRSSFTRAGLLLTEFDASLDPTFLKKVTVTGTRLRDVEVNGEHGLWFSGEPHVLAYLDRNGREFENSERLAGNTLVWSLGSVTIRLECNCGLGTARRIADSVR